MSYSDKNDTITKDEWLLRLENNQFKKEDMNRLIMNYLVTEGHKEAAEKFQIEAGLPSCIEWNLSDERILIREAVQTGRVQEAITLVNQLHPNLLDNDRFLFFHLQQLQLIEFIRVGKVEEASTFAQNKLAEAAENIPEALAELERTLTLMAFENPEMSPFAYLLEPTHRQKVASELNTAILKCENRSESAPKVMLLLKLILWAQAQLDYTDICYPKLTEIERLFDPK